MRRYRIISAIAAILFLLSATSLYAALRSRQFQLRGTTTAFPQPVRGAESLMLGINTSLEQYDDVTLDARLSNLAAHGVRYIRQEFRWSDMEPERGQINWTVADRIFKATRRNHIQVLVVFMTTPAWARAASGSSLAPATETMPPRDPQDAANFARAFTQRYNQPFDDGTPSILAYQIWDEPNLSASWGNGIISPDSYLKLLRAMGGAIKSVDPTARIVLAGLAPTVETSDVNLSPELYLQKLYEAGGRDAFDIVAAKPYGFSSPPDDRTVAAGVMNFSRVILMRDEMVAHGDGQKAIWFTQWGWNAQLPNWQGQNSIWGSVSEAEQARYTAQAIQRVASEWDWAGAMFLYTLQPNAAPHDALWGFSLLDQQGRPRPVYDAFTGVLQTAAPRAQWAAVEQTVTESAVNGSEQAEIYNPSYGPNPTASFSPGWRYSERGADIPERPDAHVSFRFAGDALAMIVRRDNYRAYMFITVDGKPANLLPEEPRGAYLILTSPDQLPHVDTIPVADHLGPGEHVADIKIDRGWNQWALIGWSSHSAINPAAGMAETAIPVAAIVLALSGIGLAFSLPRARWMDYLRLHGLLVRANPGKTIVVALLVWVTASLTWAQDAATAYRALGTPANVVLTGFVSAVAFWSPVFVISLLALVVLFVLVLLRLDVGLALLAFFIPFYLIPQHIFAKSFPMVELLTFMCLVSWAVGRIRDWRLEHQNSQLSIAHTGTPINNDTATLTSTNQVSNLKRPASIYQSLISSLSVLDWALIALVLVAGLSTWQADYKVEALRELRMVFIEPAILYLLLRTQKPNAALAWRIVDGFVLGAVAIAMIGLVNYARGVVYSADLGIERIRSVYGSPNNDALYLGRALPILLAMVLYGDSSRGASHTSHPVRAFLFSRRFLYGAGLMFVAVAIFLSVSRGALLLGVPAAVIVVCLLGGGRWRLVGIGIVVLLISGLLVLVTGVASPILVGTRFENVTNLTKGTAFFRINLWQSALMMFRDHPILGVGPDNFLYAYRGRYILPAAWQEPNLSHPHNIVLDFATRLGVLGLLTGLGLALGIVQGLRRALKATYATNLYPLIVGIVGLFADMVAHGMVDHSLFLVDLSNAFMLACGLVAMLSYYGVAKNTKALT